MPRFSQFALLLAALLVGSGHGAGAQGIATASLTNKQSVLNERAFFTFPAKTINQAREADLMSADHNNSRETRLVLDFEEMRMVFFARELYATGDKALLTQAVSAADANSKTQSKPLTDNGQLFAILSTPTVFDASQQAILVNSLLVRTADNTVFQIAAYINPTADKKRNEFIALSERVFRSFAAGTHTLNRNAHTEIYPIMATGKKFSLRLPADYLVTVDQKYDFQVLNFHHFAPYGSGDSNTLVLYAGRHPSSLFREFGFRADQAQEISGRFLDQPITWKTFSDPDKKIYLKEQQVPGSAIANGLILHVGMITRNAADLNVLTDIISGVALLE